MLGEISSGELYFTEQMLNVPEDVPVTKHSSTKGPEEQDHEGATEWPQVHVYLGSQKVCERDLLKFSKIDESY